MEGVHRSGIEKTKRHKALDLSGLVAQMIEATGETGTKWIFDLCNGIVKTVQGAVLR